MNIEKTISDLTECYRLIGATQVKIGFGIFTQEDFRFISAMYEAGLRHEKAIRAENERLKEENKLYAAEMSAAKESGFYSAQELFMTYINLKAELNEQARLLGISAEKELALLAKVEQLEMERDRLMKGEYICKIQQK